MVGHCPRPDNQLYSECGVGQNLTGLIQWERRRVGQAMLDGKSNQFCGCSMVRPTLAASLALGCESALQLPRPSFYLTRRT